MKNGFTLIEVLVVVLILSFTIAGIYGVLNIGNLTYNEGMALIDLQQQARQAMFNMSKEIRESKSITLSDGNSKVSFYIPSASYGDPWIGPIEYYRDVNDSNNDGITDQVLREYPKETKKILANYISALNFSLSGNLLEINLAARNTIKTRDLCFPVPCEEPEKMLKETIKLRNE